MTNDYRKYVKYSVLIPAYNVETYICRCIESIALQQFSSDRYEIIITDDGSKDGTAKLCDRLADKYSNVKVIHQSNKGLMHARIAGARASSGEYLLFADADDYVDANLLDIVDNYISSYNPDMLMYGLYRVEGRRTAECPVTSEKIEVLTGGEELLERFASTDRYNNMWLKVLRSDIYKDHIYEIDDLRANISEDRLQTALLLKYVDNVVLIPDCLYYYIIHGESMIHKASTHNLIEFIDNNLYILDVYTDALKLHDIPEDRYELLINSCKGLILNGAMEHVYKINSSPYITKADKIIAMSSLDPNKIDFLAVREPDECLKWYNALRYNLLRKKKYSFLLFVDMLLKVIHR